MKLYQTTEKSVQFLLECLALEAEENQEWSMQRLLELCVEMGYIVEEKEHADYSDSTFIVLAELYLEYSRWGSFSDAPEALREVRSFTLGEEAKRKVVSVLRQILQGTVGDGRTRNIIAGWERQGMLPQWQEYIEELLGQMEAAACVEDEPGADVEIPAVPEELRRERSIRKPIICLILGLLLILAAATVWCWKNQYRFLGALPNRQENAMLDSAGEYVILDGRLVDPDTKTPYTGRIESKSSTETTIYSYKDGLLDGPNATYEDGEIRESGYWRKGRQNGLFKLYTSDGVLIDSGIFKDGQRHGLTKQYDRETGTLVAEGNYVHGQMDGIWKNYFADGTLMIEQNYRVGILHGTAKQYYDNGNLYIDMNYEDGTASGPYKIYYENGQIQLEGVLKDGQYSGVVKQYLEDGTQVY